MLNQGERYIIKRRYKSRNKQRLTQRDTGREARAPVEKQVHIPVLQCDVAIEVRMNTSRCWLPRASRSAPLLAISLQSRDGQGETHLTTSLPILTTLHIHSLPTRSSSARHQTLIATTSYRMANKTTFMPEVRLSTSILKLTLYEISVGFRNLHIC